MPDSRLPTRRILSRAALSGLILLLHAGVSADVLPGINTPLDTELAAQLAGSLAAKDAAYKPRTAHLDPSGKPLFTNRLLLEDSPYLLQHAHNPVNWYPWGDEAFAAARAQNKPIFLSIGYSTCHWCHVMEEESFDNIGIATLLNEHFIAIKVDREQRPDLDNTYMTAVRLLTERGGWPMSSFLNLEGKTFWGGTYYPRPKFRQLLGEINRVWDSERATIDERANKIMLAVADLTRNLRAVDQSAPALVDTAVEELRSRRDRSHGGFGQAPKFPQESTYLLLLDQAQRSADPELAAWLEFDLDALANGGIHDHVGGGFHRYATDRNWLIPHFEKMLYTQAQLLRVYTEAHQLLGGPRYARIAAKIVAFVERELMSEDGGFYSALDADSPGGEGSFYVWTPDQLQTLLGAERASRATAWFSVTDSGNFEQANVLHLQRSATQFAEQHGLSIAAWYAELDQIEAALLTARQERAGPLRDEKVVSAWNGLMITALSNAAAVFDEPRYLERALAGAEFVLSHHLDEYGKLWRSTYRGEGSVRAMAEDYAALAEAFVALYDATLDKRWLERAAALNAVLMSDYWDAESGGFFMSVADTQGVNIPRAKALEDNAVPSGNALALAALNAVNRRTADLALEGQVLEQMLALAGDLEQSPRAHTYALRAHEHFRHGEIGSFAYAGRGAIRADVRVDGDRVNVDVAVTEGWHVNAPNPGDPDLVGSQLAVRGSTPWRIVDIAYPAAMATRLKNRDDELELYAGRFSINGDLQPTGEAESGLVALALTLQACSDTACLAPETLTLNAFVKKH